MDEPVDLLPSDSPIDNTSTRSATPGQVISSTEKTSAPSTSKGHHVSGGRLKLRASDKRMVITTAAAEKMHSVHKEMLELRKSELEMIAEQNEKINANAAKVLLIKIKKQEEYEKQNVKDNKLAEAQIAVKTRLADLIAQLLANVVEKQ
jgi:hypothetical protein